MKRKKLKCETCELNGYNSDFCRWHRKKITEIDVKACRPQDFYKKVGRTAILGAGIGVVAATAGLAAIPVVGLKGVIIGHALAAKLTAGGGAAGAGINVAMHAKENPSGSKRDKKKGVLLPLYLGGEG